MSENRRRRKRIVEEDSSSTEDDEDERVMYWIPGKEIIIEVLVWYIRTFTGADADAEPGMHPLTSTADKSASVYSRFVQKQSTADKSASVYSRFVQKQEEGYIIRARFGLSTSMMSDLKKDSQAWIYERQHNCLKRRAYISSETAKRRLELGASGPPITIDRTGKRPQPLTHPLPTVNEQYAHTDSGYGGSETNGSESVIANPLYKQPTPLYRTNDQFIERPTECSENTCQYQNSSLEEAEGTVPPAATGSVMNETSINASEKQSKRSGVYDKDQNKFGITLLVVWAAQHWRTVAKRKQQSRKFGPLGLYFASDQNLLHLTMMRNGAFGPGNSNKYFKVNAPDLYKRKWSPALHTYAPDPTIYALPLDVRFHYQRFMTRGCAMCLDDKKTHLIPGSRYCDSASDRKYPLSVAFRTILQRDLGLASTAISIILGWAQELKIGHCCASFLRIVRNEACRVLGSEHQLSLCIDGLCFAWFSSDAKIAEKRSLSPSIESEGEESFMDSLDSNEATQLWEAELDPQLCSIRSKLIQEIVSSYVCAAGNAQDAQLTAAATGDRAKNGGGSSRTTSTSQTAPSSVSAHKRARVEDDADDDIEDEQRRPNRKRLRHTTTSISIDGRLLACPYCKYDPTRYSERNLSEKNYRGCSSIYLTAIARVKQHLYRVHKRPEYYCASCFTIYDTEEALSVHSRQRPACEVKDACFTEKMTTEQVNLIKRRTIGKNPSETWFDIFKILFPNAPIPETPYVDTVSPSAVQRFTDHFYRQARSRLAALVQTELQGQLLLERDQQRILDSALESAIGQLVWQTGPHGILEDDEQEMPALDEQTIPPTLLHASQDQEPRTTGPLDQITSTNQLPALANQSDGLFADMSGDYRFGEEDSWSLSSDPIENGGLSSWMARELAG